MWVVKRSDESYVAIGARMGILVKDKTKAHKWHYKKEAHTHAEEQQRAQNKKDNFSFSEEKFEA